MFISTLVAPSFPPWLEVQGSRCNLFNNPAPLLASRFKLQYLATNVRNSAFAINFIRAVYVAIRVRTIDGIKGGPGLYVFAYARAAFEIICVLLSLSLTRSASSAVDLAAACSAGRCLSQNAWSVTLSESIFGFACVFMGIRSFSERAQVG